MIPSFPAVPRTVRAVVPNDLTFEVPTQGRE